MTLSGAAPILLGVLNDLSIYWTLPFSELASSSIFHNRFDAASQADGVGTKPITFSIFVEAVYRNQKQSKR
jgi:hypothetical protein